MIQPSVMRIGEHYSCYNKDEISSYLALIKKSFQDNNFIITKRKYEPNKNDAFIKKYELSQSEIKAILLSITVEDFCYTMLDDQNLTEVLYVFALEKLLWNPEVDEDEQVLIYIKTCYKNETGFTVVVSFHEAEYTVEYAFR